MFDPVLDLILLLEDDLAPVGTDCFGDHISYDTDVSAGRVTAVGASCRVANQCRALRSRWYKAGSRSYCEAMYRDCLQSRERHRHFAHISSAPSPLPGSSHLQMLTSCRRWPDRRPPELCRRCFGNYLQLDFRP